MKNENEIGLEEEAFLWEREYYRLSDFVKLLFYERLDWTNFKVNLSNPKSQLEKIKHEYESVFEKPLYPYDVLNESQRQSLRKFILDCIPKHDEYLIFTHVDERFVYEEAEKYYERVGELLKAIEHGNSELEVVLREFEDELRRRLLMYEVIDESEYKTLYRQPNSPNQLNETAYEFGYVKDGKLYFNPTMKDFCLCLLSDTERVQEIFDIDTKDPTKYFSTLFKNLEGKLHKMQIVLFRTKSGKSGFNAGSFYATGKRASEDQNDPSLKVSIPDYADDLLTLLSELIKKN